MIELSYKATVLPGWTVQPDLQYVINPGQNVGGSDAPGRSRTRSFSGSDHADVLIGYFIARSAARSNFGAMRRRAMNTTETPRFHYRLGANQPEASATARRLAEMAAGIERDTEGALRLDVYPESRLGPDPQMFADLRSGVLEFYLSGALLGGVAPTSALPMLPFAFSRQQSGFRGA